MPSLIMYPEKQKGAFMTDLLNGKIDFFGFEVNPSTTLQEFETAVGSKFTKKDRNDIVYFYLNNEIGVFDFVENDTRFVFQLYGMNFINVEVIFADEKIWQIKLITNMVSFVVDAEGKRHYSDEKVDTRFKIMNQWAIDSFGEPTYNNPQNTICYECNWGRIKPSSVGDSGNSKLLITYNK